MRKTALLTGVAGLFLMTAPAFAQDSTAAQTPAPATAAEQPQTLTLQPGSDVVGSDGAVLGKLEGARNTPAGQELTVRGADGQLRGVPVSGGVRQEGVGVAVGWTTAQFQAAPAIAPDADATGHETMPGHETPGHEMTEPANPAAPATPATPATPAVPGELPATPATAAEPAPPPEPANPAPDEQDGEDPSPDEPEA